MEITFHRLELDFHINPLLSPTLPKYHGLNLFNENPYYHLPGFKILVVSIQEQFPVHGRSYAEWDPQSYMNNENERHPTDVVVQHATHGFECTEMWPT